MRQECGACKATGTCRNDHHGLIDGMVDGAFLFSIPNPCPACGKNPATPGKCSACGGTGWAGERGSSDDDDQKEVPGDDEDDDDTDWSPPSSYESTVTPSPVRNPQPPPEPEDKLTLGDLIVGGLKIAGVLAALAAAAVAYSKATSPDPPPKLTEKEKEDLRRKKEEEDLRNKLAEEEVHKRLEEMLLDPEEPSV